jgi:hypothetical protein
MRLAPFRKYGDALGVEVTVGSCRSPYITALPPGTPSAENTAKKQRIQSKIVIELITANPANAPKHFLFELLQDSQHNITVADRSTKPARCLSGGAKPGLVHVLAGCGGDAVARRNDEILQAGSDRSALCSQRRF